MSKLELNKCCEDWITWHDVKDKMPELGECVLVTDGESVEIKYLYDRNARNRIKARTRKDKYPVDIIWSDYCYCGCGDINNLKITYWMYLPEPIKIPKELDS